MDKSPQNPKPESSPQRTGEPPASGVPPAAWDFPEHSLKETEMSSQDDAFHRSVGSRQARKMVRRREGEGSIWFSISMYGIIGWSVAVPTMLGVLFGYWIDRAWPGRISWTLTLMVIGVCLGCLNAWYWVQRQRRGIEERERQLKEQQRVLEEEAKRHNRESRG